MALTEIPSELSSTPSIVDNGNATAITIDSSENATFAGAISVAGNLRSASFSVGAADTGEALNILDGGHTGHGATNTVSLASFGENVSGNSSGVWLGSMTNETTAVIGARTATGNIAFQTYSGGWGERMRLSAAGDLLVGTTDTTPGIGDTGAGISMSAANGLIVSRSGQAPLNLNRNTDDGALILFRRDGAGTAVGSIGVEAGDNFYIADGATNTGLNFKGFINPCDSSGASSRDNFDLGHSTQGRLRDIYLGGGVYLGGTGAANKLSDVETGAWTPSASGLTGLTIHTARYVKVGSLVSIDLRISWTGSDQASGGLAFGLPFPSSNPGTTSRTGLVFYSGTSLYSGSAISSHVPSGDQLVGFYATSGGGFAPVVRSHVNGAYNWLVSFNYFTDS